MRFLDLEKIEPSLEPTVGGKAVGLARLLVAGAPVPPGFAVEGTRVPPSEWPAEARREFEARARQAEERRRALSAAFEEAAFWRRPVLRSLSRLVERYMPLREAPKHHAMVAFERIRGAALELGRRLAARGTISRAHDVFFLEWAEVKALAEGSAPRPDLVNEVEARRRRHEHFRGLAAPHFLRSDGEPVIEEEKAALPDGSLRGEGVSAGAATGPVRILREPDSRAMRDGDVIVVTLADPGWTPLFPRAAAVVMEVGGTLCHAAVVARELRIPAVFGVAGATSRLREGQVVRVDGRSGTVTPLARTDGPASGRG